MKKFIPLIFIMLSLNAFAQTAAKTPAKTTSKPKLTAADIAMCDKEWNIVSVEEWNIVTKPAPEKNKTDMLKLTQDGKFDLIMFGNKKSGTWTKSGQYINMVDAATKEKINFKVMIAEDKKLKVDHYSDEDGHSIFEYEVK